MSKPETQEKIIKQLGDMRGLRRWLIALVAAALFGHVAPALLVIFAMMLCGGLMFLSVCATLELKRKFRVRAREDQQAALDAQDFLQERKEQIAARLQTMMEAEARAKFRRNGSMEMFKGQVIDITPERS
jgi:hypothetical protein